MDRNYTKSRKRDKELMDAIELLKDSHRKVERLFQQMELTSSPTEAKDAFEQVYHELSVHTIIEEQVFYPALAKYPQFHELLKDAFKEHGEARLALSEIAALEPKSEKWNKQVSKLVKDINHHVKDEEEDLFPKTREFVSQPQLQELAQELEQAKSSRLNSDLLSQPISEQQSL